MFAIYQPLATEYWTGLWLQMLAAITFQAARIEMGLLTLHCWGEKIQTVIKIFGTVTPGHPSPELCGLTISTVVLRVNSIDESIWRRGLVVGVDPADDCDYQCLWAQDAAMTPPPGLESGDDDGHHLTLFVPRWHSALVVTCGPHSSLQCINTDMVRSQASIMNWGSDSDSHENREDEGWTMSAYRNTTFTWNTEKSVKKMFMFCVMFSYCMNSPWLGGDPPTTDMWRLGGTIPPLTPALH